MEEYQTVLIIEDNPATAELFTEILSEQGLKVSSIYTGKEAIAWLSLNNPDLVLLDYQLPDMEAIELIKSVKKPPFMSLPVMEMNISR